MQNLNNMSPTSEFSMLLQNGLNILLRYKMMMIIVFAIFIVLGFIVSSSMPNKYTATASLLIQDDQMSLVPDMDERRLVRQDDLELETQRQLLLSKNLAKSVIDEMNLSMSPSGYMNNLTVTGGVRSKILNVNFESTDPQLSSDIVNAHVAAYTKTEIDARRKQIESIKAKADDAIQSLKDARSKKSQLAQDLRQDNNLIRGLNSEELIYEQISEISSQIPPIESQKFAIQSKLDAINNANGKQVVSDIVDSPLLQQLKVEENRRLQEFNLLKSELGDGNPDLISARRALSATRQAIRVETNNIEESLKNELAELERQEEQLNKRLDELGDTANFQQGKMIKLKELELEEAASQSLLDSLLERFEQIQSKANFLEPKARIVTAATPPEKPSGPNRPLIIILCIIFAGMINVLIILFFELKRAGIKNFADIQNITGHEPLGIIPKFSSKKSFDQVIAKTNFQEAISKIIVEHIAPMKGGAIMVTSAQSGEGRSVGTAAFASYLAQAKNSVLIIDLDRLGSAIPFDNIQNDADGLHDLIRNKGEAKNYIQNIEDHLDYLSHGSSDLSTSRELLSDNFVAMIKKLQKNYDYILVDSPPVLAHGGIETIAAKMDGVVVMTQWLKTKPQTLAHMLRLLEASSANILGVVLNKVDIGAYKRLNPESDFLLPRK